MRSSDLQRLRVKAVYLVVAWNYSGELTKFWMEGKTKANKLAKSCRDEMGFSSVAGPIGPFVLKDSAASKA